MKMIVLENAATNRTRSRISRGRALLSTTCLIALAGGMLAAATPITPAAAQQFWDGTDTTADADGGNGNWDGVNSNWDTAATGGASVSYDINQTAVFGGTAGTVNVGSAGAVSRFDVGSMQIDTAGYEFSGPDDLSLAPGSTITLNNAGTTTFNTGFDTIGGPPTVNVVSSTGGTLELAGGGNFYGTLTVDQGATLTISGSHAPAATFALDVRGGSTLNVTGSTGGEARIGLTGAGSRLSIAGDDETIYSLSGEAGTFVELGANQLTVIGGRSTTVAASQISGAGGSLFKTGRGKLTLTGDNTFTGGVTAAGGGTLGLGSNTAAGTGTITAGSSVIDYADGTRIANSINVISDTTQFQVLIGSATQNGVISEAGGVRPIDKIGAGELVLGGSNTYTGTTRLLDGTLSIGSSERIANASDLIIHGGTFKLNGFVETVARLSGTAGTIDAGAGGKLIVNSTRDGNYEGDFTGNYTGYQAALIKEGTGTLTLSGTNSQTGNGYVFIEEGRLAVQNGNAIGNNQAVGGAGEFELLDNEIIGILAGKNNVFLNANTLTLNGFAPAFTTGSNVGIISGSGGLTVDIGNSTQLLEGANTYTGTTTVNSGTLELKKGAAIVDTGSVVINDGGTLRVSSAETVGNISGAGDIRLDAGLTTSDDSSTTFSGDLSNSGNLTKQGSGTLTLSGNNTAYGGTVIVSEGTLSLATSSAAGNGSMTIQTTGSVVDYADGVTSAAPIVVNSNTTQLQVLTGSATQNGVISEIGGARPIEKIGAGELVLGGANTYTGATTVTAGTLRIGASERISDSSDLVVNGGTFDLDGNTETVGNLSGTGGTIATGVGGKLIVNQTVAGEYQGDFTGSHDSHNSEAALTKDGAATLTLSGTNNQTGKGLFKINEGRLAVKDGNAIGDNQVVGGDGEFELLDNETVGSLAHTINVLLNANTLTLNGYDDVVAITPHGGVISGTGGLTVDNGNDTQILSGANTYTGATTVSAGTLQIGASERIADTSDLVVNGGIFDLNNFTETVGNLSGTGGTIATGTGGKLIVNQTVAGEYQGDFTGSHNSSQAALTKNGNATLTLSGTNNQTGNGRIDIVSGRLAVQNGNAIGDNQFVDVAGEFELLSSETIGMLNFNGSGNVLLNANTLTLAGDGKANFRLSNDFSGVISGSGGLTVDTANDTQRLKGANTYTGTTTVNSGFLELQNGAAIVDTGSVVINDGGTLTVSDAETVGNISGAGNLWLIAGLTTSDDSSITFSGDLRRSGNLTKQGSGTLTLSGDNTAYSGTVIVAEGTLSLATSSAAGDGRMSIQTTGSVVDYADGVTSAAPIAVNSNTTQLQVLTGSATQNGVISEIGGARPIEKIGAGELVLGGANTYTGATTVTAGTLTAANNSALGTAAAGTTVADGATLAIQGTITTSEAITLNGSGVGNGGALRNVSGTNVSTGQITLASDARINSDADQLDIRGGINGAGMNLTLGGSGRIVVGVSNNPGPGIAIGSGTLTKDGTGAVTLRDPNSFTGATIVNNGFLQLVGGSSLSDTALLTVSAPGVVQVVSGETVGNLAGDGTIFLQSTNALVAGDATDSTFSGVITESGAAGAFTKQGTGTLILSGANTYTGATTVNGGTLRIGASERISDSSDLVVNGGTFDLNSNTETVGNLSGTGGTIATGAGGALIVNQTVDGNYQGDFTGSHSANQIALSKDGAATLTLSGTNNQTGLGLINISGGRLAVQNGNAIGNNQIVTGAGEFELLSNESIGLLNGNGARILNGNTLTLNGNGLAGFGTDQSGVISGTGGITANLVDDQQILSGNNTYTGATTVNSGILRIGASERIADTSDLVVNGGTFNLDGNTETVGNLSGTGGTIAGGAGGALIVNQTVDGNYQGDFTGSYTTLQTALRKKGAGTLTLSGTNNQTGGFIFIDAGRLAVQNGNAIGNNQVVTGSGEFELLDNETVGLLGTTNNVFLNANTLTMNGIDAQGVFASISGVISGSGGLTVSIGDDNLTLFGNNTYTGATTVNGGTLRIGASERISNSSDLVVNGGTFDLNNFTETVGNLSGTGGTIVTGGENGRLNVNQSVNGEYSGGFSGATTFNTTYFQKNGAGTLRLSGNNTTAGAGNMAVSNGILELAGGNAVGDENFIDTGIATVSLIDDETVGFVLGTPGGTFNLNDKTLTLAGFGNAGAVTGTNITGTGNLVVDGALQILRQANTYTGTTTIKSGELRLDLNGSIASTDINIDGGILRTDGGALATDSDIDVAAGGLLDIDGSENLGAASTLDLNGTDATLDIAAGKTFAAGVITTADKSVVTVGAGATLQGLANTISHGGIMNVADGGNVIDAGAINILSTGVINFAGAGTLDSDTDAAGGEKVVNDGTININGNNTQIVRVGSLGNNDLVNQGSGQVNVKVGRLDVDGTLTNSSKGSDGAGGTGGVDVQVGGILNVGALVNDTGGDITSAGTITSAVATVNQGNAHLFTIGSLNGGLVNNGYAYASGQINGNVINQGGGVFTVSVYGDLVSDGSDFTNVDIADLQVISGDFTGIGTLTNNSTWSLGVDVGATRTLSAAAIVNNNGATIRNAGTLTSTAQIDNNAGATLTSTGIVNGGTVNDGTVNAQGEFNGAIVNQGTGDFNVTGNLLANSSFTNTDSATLDVNGGNFTGITTLTNSSAGSDGAGGTIGGVNIADGRTFSAGVIDNQAGGEIFVGAGSTLQGTANTNNNAGTINVADGGNVVDAGAINNQSTGVINFAGAGTLDSDTDAAGGEKVVNDGTININGNNTQIVQVGPLGNNDLVNQGSGQVNVKVGRLDVDGTLTNSSAGADGPSGTGGVDVQVGGILKTAALVNAAGGEITSAGTITSTAATVNQSSALLFTTGELNGGLVNDGNLLASGAINGNILNQGNGDFRVFPGSSANLVSDGSDFTNDGSGYLQVFLGNFTGIGTLTNNSTRSVGVDVGATRTLSAAAIINNNGATISNGGTLTSTAQIDNNAGATLLSDGTVDGGVVNDGTIAALGAFNGAIVNQGAGEFTVVLGDLTADSTFTNTGTATLDVNGGNFTGITTLTNSSAGSDGTGGTLGGVNIAATRTLSATNIDNQAGGEIVVDGTLTSTALIDNNAGATLTTTGMVNGGIVNDGRVNAAGTFNGAITNNTGGLFNLTGDLTGNSTFGNVGTLQSIGGSRSFSGFSTLTNSNNISLADGTVGQELTLNGGNFVGNGGVLNLDINLAINNAGAGANPGGIPQLADFVDMNADLSGSGVINFLPTAATFGLQDNPIVVIDNDPDTFSDTSSWTATGLPTAPGFVTVNLEKDATSKDWVVRSELNAEAVGGISGSFTAVQGILDTVVNRPSSFVSAPVQASDDECSPGAWMRAIGGAANVKNEATLTNAGKSAVAETSLEYVGTQGGIDFGCYNLGDSDINVTGGLTGGYATGSAHRNSPVGATGASLFSFTNEFNSVFYGAYGVFSVDRFFADVQVRGGQSAFKLNSSLVNNSLGKATQAITPGSKVKADTFTVAGSAGYSIPVGNFQVVPAAGFSYTRSSTDTLTLSDNSTIAFSDVDSIIGFAGLTLARTYVLDDQASAVQPFWTFTAYNDFGDDPISTFTDGVSGAKEIVTTENLGTFFEGSAGANYLKLYDEGEFGFIREINLSGRMDVRAGEDFTSFGGTLQLRIKN